VRCALPIRVVALGCAHGHELRLHLYTSFHPAAIKLRVTTSTPRRLRTYLLHGRVAAAEQSANVVIAISTDPSYL
jgi:hypothetical protein